jgi:hypothetical protein
VILLALLLWQADHDAIIQKASAEAESYTLHLPDFVCDQITERYVSGSQRPRWKHQDRLEVEVLYLKGRERYRDLRINGKRPADGREEPDRGVWSKGEYGTVMATLYSPASHATFLPRTRGVYDFAVLAAHSNWRLSVGGKSIKPAYTGTVRVDPETGKTFYAELIARGLPDSFPWDLAELRVTYDWVKIEGTAYLLPVRSENVCCVRETWTCTRNVIVFRHHRKFDTQSKLTFH